MTDKATDIIRAADILSFSGLGELREIVRRTIAGLLPDQADQAIVELFDEVDVLHRVKEESLGFTRVVDYDHGLPLSPDDLSFLWDE